jgi:hypothetical protein
MNHGQQIPRYSVGKFTSNSLVIFDQLASPLPRSYKQVENQKNLSRGDKNGYLSAKAKTKVRGILKNWVQSVVEFKRLKNRQWLPKNPYFTFVTLTLSAEQQHTDLEIRRKLVFPFIQKLQRENDIWQYFFVCEKQENGNLHIHLIIDSYIPWEEVQEKWNNTQDLHGYIDAFEKINGHRHPNSTDIHKLQHVRNVEAYLVKYCTKDKKSIPIKGRLWGCSDGLRKIKPYSEILEGHAFETAQALLQSKMMKVKIEEEYTLVYGNIRDFVRLYHGHTFKAMQKHWTENVKSLYTIHPKILENEKDRNIMYSSKNPLPFNTVFGTLQQKQISLNFPGKYGDNSSPSMRSMGKTAALCPF